MELSRKSFEFLVISTTGRDLLEIADVIAHSTSQPGTVHAYRDAPALRDVRLTIAFGYIGGNQDN